MIYSFKECIININNMITKTVVKDYVSKRCPYLAYMELEDKTLVQLLEQSIENREKYQELAAMAQEEGEEPEQGFDLAEVLRDYPHLKKEIKKFERSKPKNAVEQLIEKYNDDQIVSKLSRTYFEEIYGKENCLRCDVDAEGKDLIGDYAFVAVSQKALLDKSVKVLFEPQIEYKDLRARADVLIRNDDGSFNIIEVKGTNTVFVEDGKNPGFDSKIKDKYLYDLLFQYYVYSHAGLKINSLAFMYTNRDFHIKKHTYPTATEELNDLFILKDSINLVDEYMSLIKYFDADLYVPKKMEEDEKDEYLIEGIISTLRDIAKEKGIKPQKEYRCCKGPYCPFITMCFGEDAEKENSVFKLTRWGSYGGNWRNTLRLLNDGVDKISNVVPEAYGYSEFTKSNKRSNAYSQIKYQRGEIKEKYIVDMKKIEEIIKRDYLNDNVDYLLFFDFESFQYPIPLVENVCAWKQVVSQYSMHVVKKGYDLSKHNFEKGCGGDVTHFEYIANPDVTGYINPSIELYQTLKDQLISVGIDPYASNYKVIVFNKSFEMTRMKEFGEDFLAIADNELLKFVANFRNNVVDLLDFFTTGALYCRDFNGRGSLKVVQPTLAADENVKEYYHKILPFDFEYSLDYHKDEKCLVYNGGICLDLYKSLLVRSHLGLSKSDKLTTESLLAEALAYCKIDSWGTVIIYDVIKNFYLGKLKLDAKNI